MELGDGRPGSLGWFGWFRCLVGVVGEVGGETVAPIKSHFLKKVKAVFC